MYLDLPTWFGFVLLLWHMRQKSDLLIHLWSNHYTLKMRNQSGTNFFGCLWHGSISYQLTSPNQELNQPRSAAVNCPEAHHKAIPSVPENVMQLLAEYQDKIKPDHSHSAQKFITASLSPTFQGLLVLNLCLYVIRLYTKTFFTIYNQDNVHIYSTKQL